MGRTTEYVHDFENRLIEVDYVGMVAQYKYDPFGRRIEKNVNGDITRYFYDGADIVTEYDGNWNVKSKYTRNLIIDDPMAVEQGTNTFYYHKDGLGSVVDLTDSGGSVIKGYTYKSFGEIYSETGSLVQPFTFTGREYDPESGLYFYRARYYDPRVGKFLTKDPIGFAGGDVNLYRYVSNSPTNWIDPWGLFLLPKLSLEEYERSFPEWFPRWLIDIFYAIDSDPTIGVGPPVGAGVKTVCNISQRSLVIGAHAARQMAERGITTKMVETVLRKGTQYWDPKNKVINYVLEESFASGKSLLVGQNPITGKITTVIRGNELVRPRFVPLE